MKDPIRDEAIKLIESIAKEYAESATTYRENGKHYAAEYYAGKASGMEEAAALLRIATNTTIPFTE